MARTQALPNEHVRTGSLAADLRQAVLDHLRYSIGRLPIVATRHEYYRALALAVRDRMQDHWARTTEAYIARKAKFGQAASGSIPNRSFTAIRSFCLHPR